jgi:tellurite resistance protein TehA-like permease
MVQHQNEPRQRKVPSFGFEYFAIVMGTGIVAVLAPELSKALIPAAKVLWLIDAFLLIALSVGGLIWFAVKPAKLRELLDNKARLMFIGCVPMAVSSVSNGVVKLDPTVFGHDTYPIMFWVLVLDILLALSSGFYAPYRLFAHHIATLEELDPTWLLPIVPAEVSSFQAAVLAPHLSHSLATNVIWGAYFLWALSVPLALSLIAMIFLRLSVHKLFAPHLATSTWLILGPLGTGAASISALGVDIAHLDPSPVTSTLIGAGLLGAIVLFAYGLWWLLVAGFLSITYKVRRQYPFTMGWWGFTFPLGVLTSAGWEVALATKVDFAHLIAYALTALLVVLWAMVAVTTLSALRARPVPAATNEALLAD